MCPECQSDQPHAEAYCLWRAKVQLNNLSFLFKDSSPVLVDRAREHYLDVYRYVLEVRL